MIEIQYFVTTSRLRYRRLDEVVERRTRNSIVASLLIFLLIIYAAFAMVQGLISFPINRIVGAGIILVLVCDYLSHLTPLKIIAGCLIGVSAILCLGVVTSRLTYDLEFFTYLICTMLLLSYVGRESAIYDIRQAIMRWRIPVLVCLGTCSLLAIYALISKVGYVKSWGEENYFAGFTNGEHDMASIACLLLALSFCGYKLRICNKYITSIVFVIFTYAAFETGARTFLVPVAVLWILLINDRNYIKWQWLRVAFIVALASVAVGALASSSMASKFDYISTFASTSDRGKIDSFTSGRLDYWRVDLMGFFASGPLNQVFGNSASFVYETNELAFQMPIWAHDDFVMVLCSAGYIGLFVYVGSLTVFFNRVKPLICHWRYWLLLIYVLFPAVVNGFYGYQHLVYSAILLTCALANSNGSEIGVHDDAQ